jgi:hypothetical protein
MNILTIASGGKCKLVFVGSQVDNIALGKGFVVGLVPTTTPSKSIAGNAVAGTVM